MTKYIVIEIYDMSKYILLDKSNIKAISYSRCSDLCSNTYASKHVKNYPTCCFFQRITCLTASSHNKMQPSEQ